MDFHPNYARNGYFYIFRTLVTSTEGAGGTVHGQLSRFEASSENPSVAVPESEVVLFAQYDGSEEHNGGDVHFGPDGYLYVSLGEEILLREVPVANRQPIDRNLHGAIVRIDVDKRPGSLPPNPHPSVTTNYAVPSDNPFLGITNYQGFSIEPNQLRTEFYAIGFRNPWRFCFDPLTGGLYCADVGEGEFEEISIITPGGNYGWPYREATRAFWNPAPPPPGFAGLDPIVEYAHGKGTHQGNSVTGGVVYRGAAIPQLYGWYVFGDYVSGHIWATQYDGTPGLKPFPRLTGDWTISTFGVDPRDGEILFANLSEGRIKKLIYVPPEQAAPFPQTLADTGAKRWLTPVRLPT
jgi:glucose/arabinose dehydrogenase